MVRFFVKDFDANINALVVLLEVQFAKGKVTSALSHKSLDGNLVFDVFR